jgi:hypothetical protein
MQNIHIVNGKAGFASQYMIARANASGVFVGTHKLAHQGCGQMTLRSKRTRTSEGNRRPKSRSPCQHEDGEGRRLDDQQEVSIDHARGDATLSSAAFLIRFYAPDVMLGHHTIEELVDVATALRRSTSGIVPKPTPGWWQPLLITR